VTQFVLLMVSAVLTLGILLVSVKFPLSVDLLNALPLLELSLLDPLDLALTISVLLELLWSLVALLV